MKLISAVFLFLIWSSATVAQNNAIDKQLLWEISIPGSKEKSYLFGSIHSNDKRVFSLADSVYVAMSRAKTIITEVDLFSMFSDFDTRGTLPTTIYDKEGNPYTADARGTETAYGSEDGMPQFLDAYFQNYCYNAGKQYLPLETAKQQMDLLVDLPLSEKKVLNATMVDFSREKLIDLYLKGDIYQIDRFMRANLTLDAAAYEKLIVNRNTKMVTDLDNLLKTKTQFFCAVGAGHLGGSQGMVALMRSKGYKLRQLTWNVSEIPLKEKLEVRSKKQFQYRNSDIGLTVFFPGKPLEIAQEDGSTLLIHRELGQGNTYQVEILPNDETTTPEEWASIFIASPANSPIKKRYNDDGSYFFYGISDSYPEGLSWVQVQFNENYVCVTKVYGGNKFMHSDRPMKFFEKVWFGVD